MPPCSNYRVSLQRLVRQLKMFLIETIEEDQFVLVKPCLNIIDQCSVVSEQLFLSKDTYSSISIDSITMKEQY